MSRVKFIPYGASKGLKALSDSTGIGRLRTKNSQYVYREGDILINWGSAKECYADSMVALNKVSAVRSASNKLSCFKKMVSADMAEHVPSFVTTIERAADLVVLGKVYCRTLLSGSQGKGIVVATRASELVEAPLYTLQVENAVEVRLHVFRGEVIDFTQKRKVNSERLAAEGITLSEDIRNLSNGWVFCRDGVSVPPRVKTVAIKAVAALGLDFGAVDMMFNDDQEIVLEINTAPGLQGTTLTSYTNAINNYLGENNG